MKMASLLILIMPMVVLGFTAVASVTGVGTSSIFNPVPMGSVRCSMPIVRWGITTAVRSAG